MTFYENSTYLLYTGNVSCDVLHCHWVFHSQAMALAFDPCLVDQYTPIRGQAYTVLSTGHAFKIYLHVPANARQT